MPLPRGEKEGSPPRGTRTELDKVPDNHQGRQKGKGGTGWEGGVGQPDPTRGRATRPDPHKARRKGLA